MSFVLLLGAAASAQVSVNAFVDKKEVGADETLDYTLEIRGDLTGLDPVLPPDARGLTLAHSSPVFQERVSVNDDERLTLRWLYRPQAPGQATLLGARVRVGGRTYRTDPITVEVTPGGGGPLSRAPRATRSPAPLPQLDAAAGELFVRAVPQTRSVVPGQQVVVDYVLYFEPHLRPQRSQVVGTWDAEGFWREELEVPLRDTYARNVTVGGAPYQAVTIRRIALFPTRTGRLEIGPMTFEVDLVRSGRRDDSSGLFGSFFSRFDDAEVTAPGLTLSAAPLPPAAPPSFNGAVGRFSMRAATDLDVVTAGEPVHLTVEIEGTGNVATLAGPEVTPPPGLDAFPPEEDRTIYRNEAPLTGSKRFRYTLAPRGGGRYEIPPLRWSYYDPEAKAYRTLEAGPFTVEATGPAAEQAPERRAPDPSVPLGLLGTAEWRRAEGSSQAVSAWVLGAALGLPLLALLALLAVRRRAERQSDRSPEARALRAHPEATRRLHAARSTGSGPPLYAAVERAVRGFLADRLGIPAQGLARPALQEALTGAGVAETTQSAVLDLLVRCEQAQFAPALSDADPDALVEEAAHLLTAVDDEATNDSPSVPHRR